MTLGFKKQFINKILSGNKIHTIRKDKNNRWKPGNTIHFSTEVRTKNQHQFMLGECQSIQKIYISSFLDIIVVDDRELNDDEKRTLANNDGFEYVVDLYDWFDKDFEGVIIHWTDYKY